MDLDSGRRTLSGRDADCRSLPCSAAPLGGGAPAIPPGGHQTESLDESSPEASLGQGKDRKTGRRAAGHRDHQFPNGREDSHRGRLLRKKCRAHALSQVSSSALVCWLGCDRSWMQDGDWFTTETVRNVLDGEGRKRDFGPALLSSQRPL